MDKNSHARTWSWVFWTLIAMLFILLLLLISQTTYAATVDIPVQVVVTGNNATIKIANGTSYSFACPGDLTANQVLQHVLDGSTSTAGQCGNLSTDFIRNETAAIANQTDDAGRRMMDGCEASCRRQADALRPLIADATNACQRVLDKQDLTSIATSLSRCQVDLQAAKDSRYANYAIAFLAGAIGTWLFRNRQQAKDDIVR